MNRRQLFKAFAGGVVAALMPWRKLDAPVHFTPRYYDATVSVALEDGLARPEVLALIKADMENAMRTMSAILAVEVNLARRPWYQRPMRTWFQRRTMPAWLDDDADGWIGFPDTEEEEEL